MANAQAVEQDEFESAASAEEYVAGYFATKAGEVEDQREYRVIPKGTPGKFGIKSFTLDTGKDGKGAPKIAVAVEIHEPEAYADGSSNFTVRLSLNPVVGAGKKSSGWDMTQKQLSWLYAAAKQCTSAEGHIAMIDAVRQDFQGMTMDDVPAFQLALVENANEQLKGAVVPTKAFGIDVGQPVRTPDGKTVTNDDGSVRKYGDRQSWGVLDYPKSAKK